MVTPSYHHVTNTSLETSILPSEDILTRVDRLVNIATSSTLMMLSVVGNVLSILVLGRKSFSRMPMSVYLRFLALMDVGTVITGMFPRLVLAVADYDVRHTTDLSCKFQVFAVYVFTELSAWTLVIVTSERVLSILKPHKVKLVCTKRRSLVILATALCFFTVINIPIFFLFGLCDSNTQLINSEKAYKNASFEGIYKNSTNTNVNNTQSYTKYIDTNPNSTESDKNDTYGYTSNMAAYETYTDTVTYYIETSTTYEATFASITDGGINSRMHFSNTMAKTLVDSRRCILTGSESTKQTWYLTHFAKQSLLPFVILFIFNIIIILGLIRRRNSLLQLSPKENGQRHPSSAWQRGKTTVKISKRLYTISKSSSSQHDTEIFSSDAVEDMNDTDSQSTRSGDSITSLDIAKKTKRTFKTLKVWRRNSFAKDMSAVKSEMRASSKRGKERNRIRHQNMVSRRDVSLSVMLVTVNAVFLVCTFPIGIYQQIVPHLPVPYEDSPEQNFLFTWLVFVLYLNNTLNFVLYCVSGSRFREELKAMFDNLRCKLMGSKKNIG